MNMPSELSISNANDYNGFSILFYFSFVNFQRQKLEKTIQKYQRFFFLDILIIELMEL